MFHCFDHAVLRVQNRPETLSGDAHSLVMGTVDGELRTVEPADKGIRYGVAQVNVISTLSNLDISV